MDVDVLRALVFFAGAAVRSSQVVGFGPFGALSSAVLLRSVGIGLRRYGLAVAVGCGVALCGPKP